MFGEIETQISVMFRQLINEHHFIELKQVRQMENLDQESAVESFSLGGWMGTTTRKIGKAVCGEPQRAEGVESFCCEQCIVLQVSWTGTTEKRTMQRYAHCTNKEQCLSCTQYRQCDNFHSFQLQAHTSIFYQFITCNSAFSRFCLTQKMGGGTRWNHFLNTETPWHGNPWYIQHFTFVHVKSEQSWKKKQADPRRPFSSRWTWTCCLRLHMPVAYILRLTDAHHVLAGVAKEAGPIIRWECSDLFETHEYTCLSWPVMPWRTRAPWV